MRYSGCDTFWGALLKPEVLEGLKEARLAQVSGRAQNFVGYSLEMEHPGNHETAFETYASMPAVVARAARLIQAGYLIAISSSATQFEDTSNRIDASDYYP
jgi:hypothetical protein